QGIKAGAFEQGKIFAIGDIHGCIANLQRLFERLPYVKNRDTLVFLGDYIDRGPSSKEVIEFILDLRDSGHNLVPLMGNHEYYLLKFANTNDDIFLAALREIGAEATLESYGAKDMGKVAGLAFMPQDHKEFLNGLMPLWEKAGFIFVHGGLMPNIPLKDQTPPEIYEIREMFLSSDFNFGKFVVFGHTPFEMPLVTPTKIGIDTGAVYGNMLTAVELPDIKFYHA
ncbi:MAG: metallophosphoesterase family protein, partial [Dissulfurimicrobium sp.]